MKITFLGTGTSQGIPIIACDCKVCRSTDKKDKRLRSSVMIEVNNKTIIIDAGPDFRQQMLRENVKSIDAILLTHGHKDHIGGLDDVRAFNFKLQRPTSVYANKETITSVKRELFYAFENHNKYPGVPKIDLQTIENNEFFIDGIKILPIETLHYKLITYAYRIGDFTYITDTNFISEVELKKIRGSKVIVINALRRKKHISHFTLSEALAIIDELKPEQTYLTHLSHIIGTHVEVEKELPDNVKIAYDGLKINC
ncbi:MAG: MBL fold metallo-hydrolase [Bacteroidales bacterium]|nr:MBL fold metallo-hydrolase [Bacteroidales bacterium]